MSTNSFSLLDPNAPVSARATFPQPARTPPPVRSLVYSREMMLELRAPNTTPPARMKATPSVTSADPLEPVSAAGALRIPEGGVNPPPTPVTGRAAGGRAARGAGGGAASGAPVGAAKSRTGRRDEGPSGAGRPPGFKGKEKKARWLYKDPQGLVQGPFTDEDMLTWFEAGWFTRQLLLRALDGPADYVPLSSLLRDGSMPFRTSDDVSASLTPASLSASASRSIASPPPFLSHEPFNAPTTATATTPAVARFSPLPKSVPPTSNASTVPPRRSALLAAAGAEESGSASVVDAPLAAPTPTPPKHAAKQAAQPQTSQGPAPALHRKEGVWSAAALEHSFAAQPGSSSNVSVPGVPIHVPMPMPMPMPMSLHQHPHAHAHAHQPYMPPFAMPLYAHPPTSSVPPVHVPLQAPVVSHASHMANVAKPTPSLFWDTVLEPTPSAPLPSSTVPTPALAPAPVPATAAAVPAKAAAGAAKARAKKAAAPASSAPVSMVADEIVATEPETRVVPVKDTKEVSIKPAAPVADKEKDKKKGNKQKEVSATDADFAPVASKKAQRKAKSKAAAAHDVAPPATVETAATPVVASLSNPSLLSGSSAPMISGDSGQVPRGVVLFDLIRPAMPASSTLSSFTSTAHPSAPAPAPLHTTASSSGARKTLRAIQEEQEAEELRRALEEQAQLQAQGVGTGVGESRRVEGWGGSAPSWQATKSMKEIQEEEIRMRQVREKDTRAVPSHAIGWSGGATGSSSVPRSAVAWSPVPEAATSSKPAAWSAAVPPPAPPAFTINAANSVALPVVSQASTSKEDKKKKKAAQAKSLLEIQEEELRNRTKAHDVGSASRASGVSGGASGGSSSSSPSSSNSTGVWAARAGKGTASGGNSSAATSSMFWDMDEDTTAASTTPVSPPPSPSPSPSPSSAPTKKGAAKAQPAPAVGQSAPKIVAPPAPAPVAPAPAPSPQGKGKKKMQRVDPSLLLGFGTPVAEKIARGEILPNS